MVSSSWCLVKKPCFSNSLLNYFRMILNQSILLWRVVHACTELCAFERDEIFLVLSRPVKALLHLLYSKYLWSLSTAEMGCDESVFWKTSWISPPPCAQAQAASVWGRNVPDLHQTAVGHVGWQHRAGWWHAYWAPLSVLPDVDIRWPSGWEREDWIWWPDQDSLHSVSTISFSHVLLLSDLFLPAWSPKVLTVANLL